jgi:hypothetical protein
LFAEYRYMNLKKYNYVPGAQRSTNSTANVNVAEAIIRSIWVGNPLLCLCAAQQLAPAKCRNVSKAAATDTGGCVRFAPKAAATIADRGGS